jgi:triosephosphate isomerase (TIM)
MKLKLPVIAINLKRYDEVIGKNAVKFAKAAKKLSLKHKVTILIAPPEYAIEDSSKLTPTLSQHLDPFEPGAHTGSMLAKEVKDLGAVGSLINHSEKRIPANDVKTCVEMCKKYGLLSVVCVKDCQEARAFASFNPDFIAIEPPELIGGDISVSTAQPEIVRNAVNCVKVVSPSTNVLCGAGVKTRDDVRKSIELGASGVLLASGVAKAPNIVKAMEELIMGLK